MAINDLAYAAVYQTKLDEKVTQQATSGWMEANASDVIYNGGKEIKIPELSIDGLGDYDRMTGFPEGAADFSYRTYTMTQDRGRTFNLDANDVDETVLGIHIANVLSVFQKEMVIPEIDAYRYSNLANLAGIKEVNTLTEENILTELYKQLYTLADIGVNPHDAIISMAYPVYRILNMSKSMEKALDVSNFEQGGINLQVKSIEGAAIIPVSSNRMKTSYLFRNGKTEGQEAGGFVETDEAVDINWIMCSRIAPIALNKTDKIKLFTPEKNQSLDSYSVHYHKYHDLLVPYNKRNQIIVSTTSEFN